MTIDQQLSGTKGYFSSKMVPPPVKGKTIKRTRTLKKGEKAWMPGTTKHVWYGPGTVTYTVHPDGGVDSEMQRKS